MDGVATIRHWACLIGERDALLAIEGALSGRVRAVSFWVDPFGLCLEGDEHLLACLVDVPPELVFALSAMGEIVVLQAAEGGDTAFAVPVVPGLSLAEAA